MWHCFKSTKTEFFFNEEENGNHSIVALVAQVTGLTCYVIEPTESLP
jgi:hypothetical protein